MYNLSIALLVVVMLSGSVSLFGNNLFYGADSIHHTIMTAKNQKKLLLLYAAENPNSTCVAMENATFRHPSIVHQLSTSFYPVKLNLSLPLDQSWADHYQITTTPTLLFFDQSGTLIKRMEVALSSKELNTIIKDVLFYNTNGFWPMEAGNPIVLTTYVPPKPKTSAKDTHPVPQTSSSSSTESTDEKNSAKVKILLGQYLTCDPKLKARVEGIRKDLPQYPVRIKLAKENGVTSYQIWLATASYPPDAQELLEDLWSRGFEEAKIITIEK